MPEICEGVSFDTVAREWRFKWSPDNNKASLIAAQKLLQEHLASIRSIPGFKSVQRIVCGSCMDFKVIVALEEPSYGAWAAKDHMPESAFLASARDIKGVTAVETQTVTLMPM